jgi:hypothetical protein
MKPRSRLFTLLAACTIAGGVALAPGGVANAAPRNLPPVSQDDLSKALQCGLSAGLLKLKNGGPEAQDLYNAIKVTLVGRDLALNRLYLLKAAIQFGLAWVPLEKCFDPILFPPPAGGGASPAAPTNLTVNPDPHNGTVMLLTWSDNSPNESSFEVFNGDESRSALAHPGTGTVTYAWTGLKPGSWTCFRVRASNGDTYSNWEPNVSPWYKCSTTSPGTAM